MTAAAEVRRAPLLILRRCTCGGGLLLHVTPDGAAERVAGRWDRVHRGPDHQPAPGREETR